jgi:ribosomal protein S18 acetylase RimI-like enzyme
MEIKQARSEDVEAVHEVVRGAFEEYRGVLAVSVSALDETVEDVRREISGGRVLVALEGREIVGTVRYDLKPDCLYVGRLAVLPAYRKRGVGAALMDYVERLATALGRMRIQLATRESVPSNLRFYQRLGYRVVERVAHARGPDITVWFEKELGEQP